MGAAAVSLDERWRYAQLLVQLAEHAHRRSTAATQLAIVSDPSQLRVRIETLLNRPRTRNGLVDVRSFIALTLVGVGLLWWPFAPTPALPLIQTQIPGEKPVLLPDWIVKQQERAKVVLDDQKEQIALSKDWPLEFPRDVRQDELAGVLADSEGHPLAGALVDLYPAFTGNETTTDENGVFRYRLDKVGANATVEVRFSKEGYSPVYRRKQPLGVSKFRVVLNNKTYLEGQVLNENGKPEAKARVIASHPYVWGATYPSFNRETSTVTDENGRYRLYLFPETYTVKVVGESRSVDRRKDVEVLKDQGQKLDLRLSKGVLFEAKVLDSASKQPVAGLVLYHRTDARFRGVSSAEGIIRIPNCPPGDEEFQVGNGTPVLTHGYIKYPTEPFGSWWSPNAKKPWHRQNTTEVAIMFDLADGMAPVTLYVEAGVLVSGKVTDPDGHPVSQATVAAARTGTGNSLTGDTRYSVTTKIDGSYKVVLPSSGDGEYNMMAHDGSYATWRKFAAGVTEPMRTKPGQRIENLDIQLHRAATVRGRVKATDGRKLGGLEVRAHAYDKRGNRYYDPTTKTKEDGTFELSFIRPGKHYIQVEPMWLNAEEAPPLSSAIIELAEGETKAGIELQVVDQK